MGSLKATAPIVAFRLPIPPRHANRSNSPCRALVSRPTEPAEAPLPAPVVVERASKSLLIEVRPEAIAEVELCESAFPEQKIAEAPLVSGADQQVDLGCGICAMIDFMQQAVKVLSRKIRFALGALSRLNDAVL